MPRKKKETAMIYESPDGGATVYARPVDGKGERVLIEQPNFPDWYMNEVEINFTPIIKTNHFLIYSSVGLSRT